MNPTPTPGADIRASLTTVHRTADRLNIGDRILMSHGRTGTIVAIDRPRTVRDRQIMQVTIEAGSGDFTVGLHQADRFVITDPVMSDPINPTTERA